MKVVGVGVGHEQRLRIGVDGNEFDALQPGVDHAVDSVDTTAADTDDLHHCEIVLGRSGHGPRPPGDREIVGLSSHVGGQNW